MIADAAVLSPDGASADPAVVGAYIDSLRSGYSGTKLDTADVRLVGRLTIVDRQGATDDTMVVRLTFLNLNDVAPVEGEPALAP